MPCRPRIIIRWWPEAPRDLYSATSRGAPNVAIAGGLLPSSHHFSRISYLPFRWSIGRDADALNSPKRRSGEWWAREGLEPQPPSRNNGALPIELHALNAKIELLNALRPRRYKSFPFPRHHTPTFSHPQEPLQRIRVPCTFSGVFCFECRRFKGLRVIHGYVRSRWETGKTDAA